MSSQYLPKSMSMLSVAMNNFVRNRFKLETQGSQTASPGSIVTVQLPESALIHLPSIRFFYDVATTSETEGSTTVYGRLPADAASALISKVEIFIGGVQIQNGTAEYNTLCRILKIADSSIPRDQSVDKVLSHGAIESADAVESEQLCLHEWRGFLGESATQYLPTNLTGAVTIRLTFAGNNVLVPKEAGSALGTDLSADAKTAAQRLTYSVSNMYCTVDSCVPNESYHSALQERLSQGDIELNYREYNSFAMSGVGSSFTHRFSVSSASIDKIYSVIRDTNYLDTGIKSVDLASLTSAGTGDSIVGNAFRFRTYENGNNFRYYWTVNNVQHPQYQASSLEAICDIAYAADKIGPKASGSMITNRDWFKEGMGVVMLQLDCPTELGAAAKTGMSSKGINSQLTFKASGMTNPQAVAATGETSDRTNYIAVQTLQTLCVGLGKQLSIKY